MPLALGRADGVVGVGDNVQVCWEKFANYWDVQMRLVPMEGDRFHLSAEEAVKRCDENTIGVVFWVNYLGDNMPTFALDFSRPGAQAIGQRRSTISRARAASTTDRVGYDREVSDPMVMIDGVPSSPERAVVPLDDGLVRGDGVFEGLRSYGRRLRDPDAHLDRMARSAERISLEFPRALIAEELADFAGITSAPDCGVRAILTRSGHRVLREEPLAPRAPSWELCPVEHRISPLLIASKTLSYAANMQAARVAAAAGADAPLLIRADDRAVLEGHIFSVCWLEGGRIVFPSLETGILDSLTRRLMAEAMDDVVVRDAPVEELAGADGVLCVSTVLESQPVHAITGIGRFNPASARMAEVRSALAEITRGALTPA